MPLCMHVVRILSVTYHVAFSSVSTRGPYISFSPLGNKNGVTILTKCEFNELEAQVLGGIVCIFWRRW